MMSTPTRVQTKADFPWDWILQSTAEEFRTIVADTKSGIDFSKEKIFANQAMLNNEYLAEVAMSNQASLAQAFTSLAATGLTLNPIEKQAYLVPRKGRVILDISYLGMVRMAQYSGAVQWATAEIVYSNDHFEYNGIANLPLHRFDPFATVSDRGEFRGVYCIAKLADGSYMVDTMSAEKVFKIRATSDAYKKGKGPWVDWFEEMVRKSVIRQAAPGWPRMNRTIFAQLMASEDTEEDEVKPTPTPAPAPAAVIVEPAANTALPSNDKQAVAKGKKPETKVSESDLPENEAAHIRRVIARKAHAIQVAVDQGEKVELKDHWDQALDFIRTDNRLSPLAKKFAADQIETILSFGTPLPSQKAA